MSNSISFNDESENLSDNLNNSTINSLLPLDDDRIVEKDENGEEIIDEDKLEIVEEDDPTKKITKHNFVTSPWTKLGIVGGFFALGFGIVFLTLDSLMNGGSEQIAEVEESAPAPVPFEKENDGEVYAKLALQKQQNDLKNLNSDEVVTESDELIAEEKQESDDTKPPEEVPVRKTTVKKSPQPAKRYQPVKATQRQKPRRTTRATSSQTTARQAKSKRQSPPPQRIATAPPPAVKMPKVTIPSSNIADKEESVIDPVKDIERLRSISSFGRINYGNEIKSSIIVSNPAQNAITNNNIEPLIEPDDVSPETLDSRRRRTYEEEQELSEPEIDSFEESDEVYEDDNSIQRLEPKWEPTTIAETNNFYRVPQQPTAINKFDKFDSNQQLEPLGDIPTKAERLRNALSRNQEVEFVNTQYLSEESQILEEQPIDPEQYLMVGTSIKARLITPLVIAENNPNQNLRFIAQTTERIKSNTGQIAIPAKTQLVITINRVDSGGSMNASVTSILRNGTEYPIAPGSIDVLAKNGNPLIARSYKGGSSKLLGNDIALSAISGLAKVGEVINERDETVEDLPLGGTRTRTSGSKRNIPGALIEGAFGSLSTDIRSRTRKRTDEIMDRPRIWRVKKGKRITIRVNRSIKL